MKIIPVICGLSLCMISSIASAQIDFSDAQSRISELKTLVKTAEKKKINTLKERTTIRTAEIFVDYAKWDEKNYDENVKNFKAVGGYRKKAEQMAADLPEFEHQEILKMLDKSIAELTAVVEGRAKRRESPHVDWSQIQVAGDVILYKNNPVFLFDWTWKPDSKRYTEYFGDMDRFLINPNTVGEDGTVAPKVIKELEAKPSKNAGMIFYSHAGMPKWAVQKDPTITDGPGIKYIAYDINNPLSRQVDADLIRATVPLMAGKKYTQLGYMICNEPHWHCTKGAYCAGPISDRAVADFKVWLSKKHGNIATLNQVWGTDYKSFESIDCPNEMEDSLRGTPRYYDFMAYNMYRVTDWFTFLHDEVLKSDPQAKTHIKIMPDMWSDDRRDNGIDFETLSRMSEILGNDASTAGKKFFGKPQAWEANYAFNWRELCTGYDFMKSVSPEKIVFNTEGHLLTINAARNLYEKPEYARCNYWLAHVLGQTVIQSWYWSRREDGSRKETKPSQGYAGSNNHQPRIVNEVHATMIDLNSVSDKIVEMQRQRKPIRIFYSKAAAINNGKQMDELFDLYESLFFEGLPLGYATEGILKNNKHDWDVILVSRTRKVEASEVQALQRYLDEGGTVVVDKESLELDEYGRPMSQKLHSSRGKLIQVDSWSDMKTVALNVMEQKSQMPALTLNEENGLQQKGCNWRVIPGYKKNSYIINIVNIGKNPARLKIAYRDSSKTIKSVKNVLTDETLSPELEIPVEGVWMLQVE